MPVKGSLVAEMRDEVIDDVDQFDIVIFGATGLVGRHAVEALAKCDRFESLGLDWAVAGRSREKLAECLKRVGDKIMKNLENIPIIVADVEDEDSLVDMCRQASVLVNLVGPYRTLGEVVVRACVVTGTHYVDIAGEPQFIDNLHLKYDTRAQESGSVVVSACGFGALVFEMAICFMKKKFEGTLLGVESHMKLIPSKSGVVIGHGTWDSIIGAYGNIFEVLKLRYQLLATKYLKKLPEYRYRLPVSYLPHRPPISNSGYSVLAPPLDCFVADITNLHNYNSRNERPVFLAKYLTLPSLFQLFGHGVMAIAIGLFMFFGLGRKLLFKFPRFFSFGMFSKSGPTEEQIDGTSFELVLKAIGWQEKFKGSVSDQPSREPDKVVYGLVHGPEPTYPATATCAVQAAITLLIENEKFSVGGVFTPGAAFQDTSLVRRLDLYAIKYEIVS